MLDPVHLTQLHRIHVQLGGEFIHDPLDREGRLRSARTADRVGRRLVGEHAHAVEVIGLHLVDRGEHEHAQQRDARGDDLQIGTHVGEQVDLQAEQFAVLGRADFDVLDLVAAVVAGHHVLASGLGPLHRSAEVASQLHGEDLLAIQLQLATETTADIGSDHAQRVLGKPGDQGQQDSQDVRNLRR